MGGPSVRSLEGSGAHVYAGARHGVHLANAGVHAKEAAEHDAVAAPASSPQHAAAAEAAASASASDAVSSALENGALHVQSVHLSLKSYADHLRQTGILSDFDLAHVHHKASQEQTRQNPEDPPERWEPVAIEAAPRAPGFEDEEESKARCQSDNGRYGSLGKGGVILRYQYELTTPIQTRSEGLEGILPTLEAGITDALLPVFFPEECGPGTSDGERLLRGHRRLNRVVGIDSDPEDFVLAGKECTAEQTLSNSACHSLEGALTLHFPPHYNVLTLIQGAQLSALNAIREGMSDGSLAEVHEDIWLLKFLDASYSLRPVMPQDATAPKAAEEDGGGGNGGLVAGILVPLLLACCCAGLLCGWRRSGRTLDDLRSAALPRKKARSPLDLEEDEAGGSLHKPKSERKMKSLKRRSVLRRREDEDTDAEMEEVDPAARQLREELTAADALLGRKKRTTARSAVEEGGFSDDSQHSVDDEGGAYRNSVTTGSSSAAGDELRSSTNSSGSECTTSTEGGSTTTGSKWSDSDSEGSATSSDDESGGESMAGEDDRVNGGGFHELEQQVQQLQQVRSTFATQRREARRQRAAEAEERAPKTVSSSNNLVMAGRHADDEASVRTGATGVHSLASQATEQVDNTRGDDASATAGTTGVRGRTRKGSNAARDRLTGGAKAYSGVLPSYSN